MRMARRACTRANELLIDMTAPTAAPASHRASTTLGDAVTRHNGSRRGALA